ncbi:MAG: hypothetical protein R2784_16785 [Saprospiraceae bacterium]
MDNSKKTIDVRYKIQEDSFGLSRHFSVDDLTNTTPPGISSWWSCGFIEPAENASVLIEDTWGRAWW